jgi:hypothetical protein
MWVKVSNRIQKTLLQYLHMALTCGYPTHWQQLRSKIHNSFRFCLLISRQEKDTGVTVTV